MIRRGQVIRAADTNAVSERFSHQHASNAHRIFDPVKKGEPKPEPKEESQPVAEPEPQPEAKAEPKPGAKAKPLPKAKTET